MSPEEALVDLLGRIGANQGEAVFVNEDALSQWPDAAVVALKAQKLLTKAKPAEGIVCDGCEEACAMPVHVMPATDTRPARAFISCGKRDDVARIRVDLGRLEQWQCGMDAVCAFITISLSLRRSDKRTAEQGRFEIGIFKGNKRSQMLCLQTNDELTLIAGDNSLPLAEVVEYRDGKYLLNSVLIRQLVDAVTTADNRYTPSNAKREARKLDTQAMYESWQKEYRNLHKKHKSRNMSETWYSQQIAKMDIAKGRDASTIKKHMKP